MSEARPGFDKIVSALLAILLAAFGYLARQLDAMSTRLNTLSEKVAALEAGNQAEHRSLRSDMRELRQSHRPSSERR